LNAIENGPVIVDLPIENGDFPMLVYQRVFPRSREANGRDSPDVFQQNSPEVELTMDGA
jgi:hypothetical protein